MENLQLLANRIKTIDAQLADLNKERERVMIAIEVFKSLTSPQTEQQDDKKTKDIPLKVFVMKMFVDKEPLSVQQVYEGVSLVSKADKATINTTLSNLVKKGELVKRGYGLYGLP